ncbi:GcrA family cell cycle regulator [Methylocystis sp. MJC1]|uniref:GcrA family cell cycle regulator n=2 Tax=Methylocystis sp. MJC1 TaxID=2654282 RepID=UPI0034D51FE5
MEANMDEAAGVIAEDKQSEPEQPGITFEQLREGRCKFPLGRLSDPPERFCGEPVAMSSPYCGACRLTVYARSVRRRGRLRSKSGNVVEKPRPRVTV